MPSQQLSPTAAVFLWRSETCHFCMSAAAPKNPSADWSWYLHVAILHLADPTELSRCSNLSATSRIPPHLAYVPQLTSCFASAVCKAHKSVAESCTLHRKQVGNTRRILSETSLPRPGFPQLPRRADLSDAGLHQYFVAQVPIAL